MTPAADHLLAAGAVRAAGQRMLEDGLAGRLEGWTVRLDRMPETIDYVASVTRQSYPDLNVPFHSRWRHFSIAGLDRWANAVASHSMEQLAVARSAYDLAILSVLLDAGSGGQWCYREPETGGTFRSSEGLALASFDLFVSGRLSTRSDDPMRADAERLAHFTEANLAEAFQVGPRNPLVGLAGRAALLNRLGRLCLDWPDTFLIDGEARAGHLFDRVAKAAHSRGIAAPALLRLVLETLGPIWPGRLSLGGVGLGDTWRYERWRQVGDDASGFVPFHKLSQWLTYSLIEPLQAAGVAVIDIDGLTGLAEYRNGGLFIDMGVLVPKNPQALARPLPVSDPIVIEWRALTVALLDRLASLLRAELGVEKDRLPLACVLQGGTWSAGRQIARERRANGEPPLRILSDGTTF